MDKGWEGGSEEIHGFRDREDTAVGNPQAWNDKLMAFHRRQLDPSTGVPLPWTPWYLEVGKSFGFVAG